MGFLEWTLVAEVMVLVVAGICGATAYFSRPMHQDPDPFLRAMMGFWRTVTGWNPHYDLIGSFVKAGGRDSALEDADEPLTARSAPVASAVHAQTTAAAPSPVLRGGPGPAAVAVCSLGVTVVPHSTSNEILGRTGDGLHIAVSGAADDAIANKLVLAMIAREFDIRPYRLALTRGHFNAAKVIRISGVDQDQLERMLQQFPSL